MPNLERVDDVFVLNLGDTENVTSLSWVADVNTALDEVENHEGPNALVTTATGKNYSQGLDVAFMNDNPTEVRDYLKTVIKLLARVLTFPAPTVAAVNGHAFGAGAFLATAHDQRVQRADRGFFCYPEVQIGMSFPPPFYVLAQAKFTPQTWHHAMVTGHRYGGIEAVEAGIANESTDEAGLVPAAIARAQSLTQTPMVGQVKRDIYASELAVMLKE